MRKRNGLYLFFALLYCRSSFSFNDIQHTYTEMLTQCIFQIAAGYEDADDCDDSNANTYGEQQLTLFNNYYGEYCYMPLFIFEGISGKMILPLLRPGRGNKSINIFGLLKRIITLLRKSWKKTRFILRGDSHFCCKE